MADVLERTLRARVRLTRNDLTLFDQTFYEPDETYTESTHQRVVLATSMASPSEVDMGGIVTGEAIFIETDRAISVGIDSNTTLITLNENGAFLLTGSFDHVYLQNTSSTNQATVELVITD